MNAVVFGCTVPHRTLLEGAVRLLITVAFASQVSDADLQSSSSLLARTGTLYPFPFPFPSDPDPCPAYTSIDFDEFSLLRDRVSRVTPIDILFCGENKICSFRDSAKHFNFSASNNNRRCRSLQIFSSPSSPMLSKVIKRSNTGEILALPG